MYTGIKAPLSIGFDAGFTGTCTNVSIVLTVHMSLPELCCLMTGGLTSSPIFNIQCLPLALALVPSHPPFTFLLSCLSYNGDDLLDDTFIASTTLPTP